MNIRQTSLQAYREIQSSGEALTQRQIIMTYIRNHTGITRQEISNWFSIPINATCGRVNELIKSGMIREEGKRISYDRFGKPLSDKENLVLFANNVVEYG